MITRGSVCDMSKVPRLPNKYPACSSGWLLRTCHQIFGRHEREFIEELSNYKLLKNALWKWLLCLVSFGLLECFVLYYGNNTWTLASYVYMLKIYRLMHDKNRNILRSLLWGKNVEYKFLKMKSTREYLGLIGVQLANGMGYQGIYWHIAAITVAVTKSFLFLFTQWRNVCEESRAPLILNLGSKWRWRL